MSEYQYYEFVAIDRPLTAAQITEVERFSSRADVTSTRFVNEYQWGDFRGDVHGFLRDWFDVFVYVANWGTRRLAMALPKELVDVGLIRAYSVADLVEVTSAGNRWILDIESNDDSGDRSDSEGDGQMGAMAGLRAEVLAGDLRPLMIGWLAGVRPPSDGDEDDDWSSEKDNDPLPPIPAGMKKLSAAQQALAEFLEVDSVLLELTARSSEAPPPTPELAGLLHRFSPGQKEQWLLELLNADGLHAAARILRQIRPPVAAVASSPDWKSVGDLRQAWADVRRKERAERLEAEAALQRRRNAEAAAKRQLDLDRLATRWAQAWTDVDFLIKKKNRDSYAKAIALLQDLKAVASRPNGDAADFARRIDLMLHAHDAKGIFIEMYRRSRIV